MYICIARYKDRIKIRLQTNKQKILRLNLRSNTEACLGFLEMLNIVKKQGRNRNNSKFVLRHIKYFENI